MSESGDQRRIIIFGASTDVGGVVARAVAAPGTTLALTTTTGEAEEAFELRRLSRQVTERGATAMVEAVDLGVGANVQVAIRQIAKALGGIDAAFVVPNLRIDKPFERWTDGDWSRVVNGNLGAVFYVCRGLLREMTGEGKNGGRIVVVRPALASNPDDPAYAATTAGIASLTASLGQRFRDSGVVISEIEAVEPEDVGPKAAAALS